MAAKLQSDNATNVHVLAPRKAKGAGGQKRKGPSTNRTKPRPGESRPATTKKAGQPTDAEIRANQQDRLIALHTQHRTIENREAVAGEAMSEIRGQKKLIRAAIQNAGFPLELYDEADKKLKLKTKRTDLEARERIRGLIHEAFGLPVGPQPELALEGVPEAARPALHWETIGYQQGIDGLFADPERDGVPPENLQDYMRGFESVTRRNAAGIKALKADPPKGAAAPPLMVGEKPEKAAAKQAAKDAAATVEYAEKAMTRGEIPAWNGFPDDPNLWTDGQKDVFTRWAEALDPTAEVDLVHAGAIAFFDELYPPEEADSQAAPGDPAAENAAQADDFEATPEELAAQAGRPGGHSDAAAEFED